MTIEAQYLANKLAKGFIGTDQIESNSRLCMASAGSGYKLSLGADGPPGSYDDLDHADVFLVIGSNMADCHPILFLRLLDRVKRRRQARSSSTRAARRRPSRPTCSCRSGRAPTSHCSTGCSTCIVEDGRIDHDFIARHTEGWDDMPALLADYPPATRRRDHRPRRGRHAAAPPS